MWLYRSRLSSNFSPNSILLDFRENRGATGPWPKERPRQPIEAEFGR